MAEMKYPNVIGIGAMKGGTTYVYRCLRDHNDVNFTNPKELHYFDRDKNYKKGKTWYLQQFDYDVKIVGEFTPSYMYTVEAFERMKKDVPQDTKFLVFLRNPVDRAYRHYMHNVAFPGRNPEVFEKGIILEHARRYWDMEERARWTYIDQGFYGHQLTRWFDAFPRDNFYIRLHDDLADDPKGELKKLCKWLDVPFEGTRVLEWNENHQGRYSPLSGELREQLIDVYREDVQRLEELLDRDLSAWKK